MKLIPDQRAVLKGLKTVHSYCEKPKFFRISYEIDSNTLHNPERSFKKKQMFERMSI